MLGDNSGDCTPEERQHRLDICKTCENFYFKDQQTFCSACECSLSLLITFKVETCPENKW